MPRHTRRALAGLLACWLALLGPTSAAASGLPVSTAPDDQWSPRIVRTPGGGAWVAWLDERNGYSTDVYGCRLDVSGAPSTSGADQGTALTWITCKKQDLVLAPDGTGGTFAAWSDHRCDSALGYDIYVLRLGPDGLPLPGWPANGTAVRAAAGNQLRPAIAPDGTGGGYVVWLEQSPRPARLFAQHIDPDGVLDPTWPAAGVLVALSVSDSTVPNAVSDGSGGCYVAWEDRRGSDLDIRVQRLTVNGSPASGWTWGGVAVCTAIGDQWSSVLLAGSSGPTVVWQDERGAATQVYASRHLPSGARAPGWPVDGLPVALSMNDQFGLAVARAGGAGVFVAWSEDRGLGTQADLCAQRLDSAGVAYPGWPATGSVVCGAPGRQGEPSLTPDAAGGLFVGWSDRRDSSLTGTDLFVQRLLADGSTAPGWPASGHSLCGEGGEQRELQLVPDGLGGAFAVWTDGRDTTSTGQDIASHRVSSSGPVANRPTGIVASHHDGQTFLRWTAPPGKGWTYRVHASTNPIATSADLAAATLVGSTGDSSACDLRLSRLRGATYAYRIVAGGPELPPASGLFVRTVGQAASTYYAVTGQAGAFAEDLAVVPGENSQVMPVAETPAVPSPVYQRSFVEAGPAVEIWTLWTANEDAPGFPAMAGVNGLAFDCGLVRGAASQAPLVVRFHARGGSLFDATGGAFLPGEWVLALDDALPNGENTFWFGYHAAYDVTQSGNPPPLTGQVVGFTARRVDWTLDWVRRQGAIDTTRVFTYGYSMGAMGSTQLAFRSPAKLAGVMSVIGQFDFSFLADPEPACWFNPGGPFRSLADEIWGSVSTNLPTVDGPPVFSLLNGTRIAEGNGHVDLPPLLVFNGRKDLSVGWAEKVHFWEAMHANRRGGCFFWDNRDHGVTGAVWGPMQNPGYLDRFRTDRSFPALSGGDLDGVIGDGSQASGDSVGTLNGHIEWNAPEEDIGGWRVTLTLRGLVRTTGSIPVPESALVDVTPRRLQQFSAAPLAEVPFRVVRIQDGAVLAYGITVADSFGVVTVEGVRVHRLGTRVEIGVQALAGAAPAAPAGLRLSCATLARGGSVVAAVDWPAADESRLDLIDVGGRRARTLFHGRPAVGPAHYSVRTGDVAPGLYFLRARCGAEHRVQRVVVLR